MGAFLKVRVAADATDSFHSLAAGAKTTGSSVVTELSAPGIAPTGMGMALTTVRATGWSSEAGVAPIVTAGIGAAVAGDASESKPTVAQRSSCVLLGDSDAEGAALGQRVTGAREASTGMHGVGVLRVHKGDRTSWSEAHLVGACKRGCVR